MEKHINTAKYRNELRKSIVKNSIIALCLALYCALMFAHGSATATTEIFVISVAFGLFCMMCFVIRLDFKLLRHLLRSR